jgi:hypothetical protein
MSMGKTLRWAGMVFILALATGFSLVPPALAHSIPMTDRQMVHESEHIVIAVVESASVRWNPQHTLIFTDYTLRIEDRLKGEAPERVTLSVPGGTLDGETQGTCLSTPLAESGRYLLFLGDFSRPTLSPVTGAEQGAFQEIVGADGKRYAGAGGATSPLEVQGRPVEFQALVAGVRALVEQVRLHPEPSDDPVKGMKGASPLPAKAYDPSGAVEKGRSLVNPAQEPATVAPPPWTDRVEAGALVGPVLENRGDAIAEDYVVLNRPPAPITFNNFPAGFPFAPYDQYQMAYWNTYAKNLFRVYTHPTGTWSFGNGVFDLAGFPGNDVMLSQFGAGWGSTTLGITYYRVQSGKIIEADIALNPAYAWTVDDRVATQPTGAFSFKHVMLHEVGHSWGLQHPWETQNVWWDSVMNYSARQFNLARLWADDTTAARKAFPGISIRDGAISAYTTQDSLSSNNAAYVPSYPSSTVLTPGGTITIVNPIKLENSGTATLSNPTIEVYLTPQLYSFTGAILLKSIRYKATVKTNQIVRLTVGTLPVPRSFPPGNYYIAYFYRDAKDAYQANNSAWDLFYPSSAQGNRAASGQATGITVVAP